MRRPALRVTLLAALLAAVLCLPRTGQAGVEPGEPAVQRTEREGIAVEVTLEPLSPAARGRLEEGRDVAFRFAISDTATGTPLAGLYPAAWMDLLSDGEVTDPEACVERVEEFIGGSLFAQAELDLNVYYVLALNHDPTITVVDPLFGYGGTKLLALVSLNSPGEDWVLSHDRSRLFVSQPETGEVAVVSTADWKVKAQLEIGGRPRRLALQADGAYLWVASDAEGPGSGVVAVDTRRLEVAAWIPTGPGAHAIALADDSRRAWVTNSAAGTVSVIDVAALARLRDVKTGGGPGAIAYQPLARAAYATHRDGTIAAIDGDGELVARIEAEPGLGQIRFVPDSRLGFAVNPEADVVHIVDAAKNRIVQTVDVFAGPEEVAFSDELAYVRHRDSEIVLMIPLSEVGREGLKVPVVDFPGGQEAFGRGLRPSPAPAIVQAPGATAVLVANPADRMIYYYKEGMAAPMGGFVNYERQPRAVMVVDRSLRERRRPGVYETAARLRSPGRYRLAFFLDTPRIVHCFEAEVVANPELEAARRAALPVTVEPMSPPGRVAVGEPVELRYRLTDPNSGEPVEGLGDVRAVAYRTGNWKLRLQAAEAGGGVYGVSFTPPAPGSYFVAIECPSRRLSFHQSPQVRLLAVAAEARPEKRTGGR